MFFWRIFGKKKPINVAELVNIKINKVENKFYSIEEVNFKDRYSVNTVSRNLPIELINGEFYVTARYTNIPGSVIYFFIRIKNLQSDYVTINNTVDLKINAEIKKQECKYSKIEVLPASKIGGLLPCG